MSTYQPAMAQVFRHKTSRRQLVMVYALDGTVLDAIDVGDEPENRPLWTLNLTRIIEVEVSPAEWRKWKRCAAIRTGTEVGE